MLSVTVDEAQKELPAYLKLVETGETLVITQNGAPVAELKSLASGIAQARPFGLCAGEFVVPDDFDQPLPEDIVEAFEGQ